MAASNHPDCFRECIGRTIKGIIFDALPRSRKDLSLGNKTLIFDDGTGLTFGSNGSYWRESSEELRLAVLDKQRAMEAAISDLRDVLTQAGA